jgi:hypothetical protein
LVLASGLVVGGTLRFELPSDEVPLSRGWGLPGAGLGGLAGDGWGAPDTWAGVGSVVGPADLVQAATHQPIPPPPQTLPPKSPTLKPQPIPQPPKPQPPNPQPFHPPPSP